ncbi:MAG: hypothetical protein ACPLPS_10020 [bacterium]
MPEQSLRALLTKCRELLMSPTNLACVLQGIKELVWEYGEVGYELGLEIAKGLEYLRAKEDGLDIALPRTTSLLERDIKEFRRRVRPMDGFFTAIWVKMRNLQCQEKDWVEGIMLELSLRFACATRRELLKQFPHEMA